MRNITESELLSVYGGAGDEEGEIVVTANKKFDYSIYQNSDGSFIGAAFVGPSSLLSGGGGGSGSASDSDEGDPNGDDDGDGIPNHAEEIVVEAIPPELTDLGGGLWGRLYGDGIAEVWQENFKIFGQPIGQYIGKFEYSIIPQEGGWSYSFPLGITYTPAGNQYVLTRTNKP